MTVTLDSRRGGARYASALTKVNWDDAWESRSNLHATELIWSLQPDVGRAILRWRYGLNPANNQVTEPLSWLAPGNPSGFSRPYVRVESIASGESFDEVERVWYGTIESIGDEPHGAVLRQLPGGGTQKVRAGVQHLTAVGLEQIAHRHVILGSRYENSAAIPLVSRAGMTFNHRGEPNLKFNISGSPIFAGQIRAVLNPPIYWSSRAIVRYLVGELNNPSSPISFFISAGDLQKIPDYDAPELPTHGQTVGDLLNQVLSRYRQMSWHFAVVPGGGGTGDVIALRVHRLNSSPITLPGIILPGNDDVVDLAFTDSPNTHFVIQDQAAGVVDQVIYQGARRRNCFSVSHKDGTLEAAWSPAELAAYNAGGSNNPDYPTEAKKADRQRFDSEARSAEELRDVFSRFRLPINWDYQAGDGEGGGNTPVIREGNGKMPDNERFLIDAIPLLSGRNYKGTDLTPIATGAPPFEERLPLLVMPTPADPDRWIDITTQQVQTKLEPRRKEMDDRWGANIAIEPSGQTIRIDVQGTEKHILGKGEFSKLTHDPIEPLVSWKDFIVTVAIELDDFCEGRWPSDAAVDPLPIPRRKLIDAGPAYKLDYLHTGTVTGVDKDSGELIRSTGGYIRDDTGVLESLAKSTYQWYQTPRTAIELDSIDDDAELQLGRLVSSVMNDSGTTPSHLLPVNTVITKIQRRYPVARNERSGEPSRMSLQTAFHQFDPVRM